MGIPSYFNFILKHHKTILVKKKNVSCDNLFIDANSLIYDCIHELKKVENEEKVYEMVYEKIIQLIQTIDPKIKTYVCFDGIPPYPKMVQQRQRRFKSVLTKQILNDTSCSWNTNHITPGTDFMNKLDDFLTIKFKKEKKVSFSGSNEPMEGEHKICYYLRSQQNLYENKTNIIYGLDADLIMLGLLLHSEHFTIYLYKETKHFDYISNIDSNQHYLFDISCLSKEVQVLLNNFDETQCVCDYIFMCFLCGNDFTPHVPCISLRNDGIKYLILKYKELNKPLINIENRTILWKNFRNFIYNCQQNENQMIKENLLWKLKLKHRIKENTLEERLNYLPCMDTIKEQYLYDNLSEYNSYILESNEVKDICLTYLKILEWTWYYYNGKNINNRISYTFSYGPLFNDLIHYIPLFDSQTLIKQESKQQELDVITQLYFVLPQVNHKEIIPKDIYDCTHEDIYDTHREMKIMNFEFDYFLCKFFWESHLKLNEINIDKLNHIVKYLKKNRM